MKQSNRYAVAMSDPCLVQVLDMVRRIEAQAPDDLIAIAKASPRRNDTVAKWFERRRHAVIQAAADAAALGEALALANAEIKRLRRDLAERGDINGIRESRSRFEIAGGVG